LDNADEQAATIRRELDSRMKQAENIQKVNKIFFLNKIFTFKTENLSNENLRENT